MTGLINGFRYIGLSRLRVVVPRIAVLIGPGDWRWQQWHHRLLSPGHGVKPNKYYIAYALPKACLSLRRALPKRFPIFVANVTFLRRYNAYVASGAGIHQQSNHTRATLQHTLGPVWGRMEPYGTSRRLVTEVAVPIKRVFQCLFNLSCAMPSAE